MELKPKEIPKAVKNRKTEKFKCFPKRLTAKKPAINQQQKAKIETTIFLKSAQKYVINLSKLLKFRFID